ncbi:MAG: hypothetical protein CVU56_06310 [Deltaproteobacteria bacterium HGW-Deltaproteobacteria-14]|jgi:hypothetical protein|nr:MAG: hypothetical protein CVU56_06310 [Deltaproteobacteria bacterium HGW-Deltaproteobacteria-14]
MAAATKLVWTGRWPLVPGLDVWTRVFNARPHRYFIVLDYPPVALPGALGRGFTVFSPELPWTEVHGYLERCGMSHGWSPAAPPPTAPRGVASPTDPAAWTRRTVLRPQPRRRPGVTTRRVSPRLAGARRGSPPTWACPPVTNGAA